MSGKTKWVVVAVAVGLGLAILIGVLGTRNEPSGSGQNTAQATSALCSSLKNLGSSVQSLVGLGKGASKSDYQSAVNQVETDWSSVQSDYSALKQAEPGELSSAWSSFESAVKAVPSSDSASDAVSSVTQSADGLKSAAQTTASQLNCS